MYNELLLTMSSSSLIEKKTAVDPLLKNMYNNGHKVVAFPAPQRNIHQQQQQSGNYNLSTTGSGDAIVSGDSSSNSNNNNNASNANNVMIALHNNNAKSVDRPRSLSAGRTARSSDIVQDIYDRLGVRRGASGKDQGKLVNVARRRGRSTAGSNDEDDQRRSHSTGRRRLTRHWPPPQERTESAISPTLGIEKILKNNSGNSFQAASSSITPTDSPVQQQYSKSTTPAKSVSVPTTASHHLSPKPTFRQSATNLIGRSGAFPSSSPETNPPSSPKQQQQQRSPVPTTKYHDHASPPPQLSSPPTNSVQDRLRAYTKQHQHAKKSIVGSSRNSLESGRKVLLSSPTRNFVGVAPGNNNNSMVSPQIDIYSEGKNRYASLADDMTATEEEKKDDGGDYHKGDTAMNRLILCSDDTACSSIESSRRSLSGGGGGNIGSSHNIGNNSNPKIASAFLAAINSPNKQNVVAAPLCEVTPTAAFHVPNDADISVVSDLGLEAASHPTALGAATKSMGMSCANVSNYHSERNRVPVYGNSGISTTTNSAFHGGGGGDNKPQQQQQQQLIFTMIEKMVSDRVRIRMKESERVMEDKFQEYVQRTNIIVTESKRNMDEKYREYVRHADTRVSARMDELESMIELLLAQEQRSPN